MRIIKDKRSLPPSRQNLRFSVIDAESLKYLQATSDKYGFSQAFVANKIITKALQSHKKELDHYFAHMDKHVTKNEAAKMARFTYEHRSYNTTEIRVLAGIIKQVKLDSFVSNAREVQRAIFQDRFSYRQVQQAIAVFKEAYCIVENYYPAIGNYREERVWTITNKGFDLVNQAIDQGYLK